MHQTESERPVDASRQSKQEALGLLLQAWGRMHNTCRLQHQLLLSQDLFCDQRHVALCGKPLVCLGVCQEADKRKDEVKMCQPFQWMLGSLLKQSHSLMLCTLASLTTHEQAVRKMMLEMCKTWQVSNSAESGPPTQGLLGEAPPLDMPAQHCGILQCQSQTLTYISGRPHITTWLGSINFNGNAASMPPVNKKKFGHHH